MGEENAVDAAGVVNAHDATSASPAVQALPVAKQAPTMSRDSSRASGMRGLVRHRPIPRSRAPLSIQALLEGAKKSLNRGLTDLPCF